MTSLFMKLCNDIQIFIDKLIYVWSMKPNIEKMPHGRWLVEFCIKQTANITSILTKVNSAYFLNILNQKLKFNQYIKWLLKYTHIVHWADIYIYIFHSLKISMKNLVLQIYIIGHSWLTNNRYL